MDEVYYTHALWKVKAGKFEEFIAAWKGLSEVFLATGGTTHGTLIQSLSDPTVFYSFGPWASLEHIQEMRAEPGSQAAIGRLRELCNEANPGTYRVAVEIRGGEVLSRQETRS